MSHFIYIPCNRDIWKDKIFIFDDWKNIFNAEIKNKAIILKKDFALYNVSDIQPHIIIKTLGKLDLNHEEYYGVYETRANIVQHFDKNHIIGDDVCWNKYVFTSYYPIFEYYKYTKLDVDVKALHGDIITIDNKSCIISVNDKLFFKHKDENNIYTNDVYEILKINKYVHEANQSIMVTKTIPTSTTKLLHHIQYKLYLNKQIKNIAKSMFEIYLVNHVSFCNDMNSWI